MEDFKRAEELYKLGELDLPENVDFKYPKGTRSGGFADQYKDLIRQQQEKNIPLWKNTQGEPLVAPQLRTQKFIEDEKRLKEILDTLKNEFNEISEPVTPLTKKEYPAISNWELSPPSGMTQEEKNLQLFLYDQ